MSKRKITVSSLPLIKHFIDGFKSGLKPQRYVGLPSEPAYLKPIRRYAFLHESGANGLIMGIFWVTPQGCEQRPCYKLAYPDGLVDYVPVSDVQAGLYKIVESEDE